MKKLAITISISFSMSVLTLNAQPSADISLISGRVEMKQILIEQPITELQLIPSPKLPASALRLAIHLPDDKEMVQVTQARQAELDLAQKKQDEEKQNDVVNNSLSVSGNYDLTNISFEDLQKVESGGAVAVENQSIAVKVIPLQEEQAIAPTAEHSVATSEVKREPVMLNKLSEGTDIPVNLTVEIHKREVKSAEPEESNKISLSEKLQKASYVDVNERIPVSIRRESGSVISKYGNVSAN